MRSGYNFQSTIRPVSEVESNPGSNTCSWFNAQIEVILVESLAARARWLEV
jgi:hypothetical protein